VTLKLWHKVALPVKQEELFYQIWTSCNLLLSVTSLDGTNGEMHGCTDGQQHVMGHSIGGP